MFPTQLDEQVRGLTGRTVIVHTQPAPPAGSPHPGLPGLALQHQGVLRDLRHRYCGRLRTDERYLLLETTAGRPLLEIPQATVVGLRATSSTRNPQRINLIVRHEPQL